MTNVQLVTNNLIHKLERYMDDAKSIYILTSFVMKSGVDILASFLRKAAEKNVDIKICTGDYLYITQPDALEKLYEIHPDIDIRLWRSAGKSFHPKAYLFEHESEGVMIVGSSNMSRSALTSGVEWSLLVKESVGEGAFSEAIDQFLHIHMNEATQPINIETIKQYRKEYEEFHTTHSSLVRTWTKQEEIEMMIPSGQEDYTARSGVEIELEESAVYETKIVPRFAQLPALEQLENVLEEGYNKAMVVMATGLGKTYLAAFFAKRFKRVLFIAHLEEILNQAEKSFLRVIDNKTTGIYNGKKKEGEKDVVFASIQTLSRKRHLENFSPNDFDLIIVDEFHHAAANSYQRVLDYFDPNFLLGITATPDRNDFRDIYSICDGNVAYRIDFMEAIQRGWLSPFHYYGVHDDTDYSQIRWIGNKYDREELAQVQLREELALNILEAWKKYKKTRTIVFCSSIRQAVFLSIYFNESGYSTISLHSETKHISREDAIKQLDNNELDAIFTVDLFNEGVDIPSVDTLLFVRPTESLTIFTQQIGRGLRLHEHKEYCVVIDLIANYRNADIKMQMLRVDDGKTKGNGTQNILPDGCTVEFELEAKQLLDELLKKKMPRKEKLQHSYQTVKMDLGRRPTYLELHKLGIEESKEYRQEFKSYVGFLAWNDELTELEKTVFLHCEAWLQEVEKTGMAKSYKMLLLLAMLQRGKERWYHPISSEEVAPFFYQFLMEKEYRKKIDFSDKQAQRMWEYDEEKVSKLIATMPMTKWSGSSKGLLSFDENFFSLNMDVRKEDEEILFEWTKEICEYRLHTYFERRTATLK
ncbi:DNA helicase [Bacillus thuringiensis]|uniref:DEAD/DEAH box helicase family protein n=1 Tax=Bacillus TaxID=1386 RepID=UPI000A376ABB|nr:MULTISPECIES: DEAD/DEAH box helicase family protein [Bacillus]AXR15503.1 DNA helicase [Bacillus sp. CR71]AXR21237.1 DNA helicase [Bacillus sp. E25]MEC2704511.1 DEAD/DEAH box helicase family protein [Bacillus thuringiensis]OUB66881.1 DNA helicase [Bacillus thuringiensis serovar dakota]PFQ77392.1 DNA helicase [Bacillus thuringiensis]